MECFEKQYYGVVVYTLGAVTSAPSTILKNWKIALDTKYRKDHWNCIVDEIQELSHPSTE